MIKSLQDLRDRVNTIIKVIPNNSPDKTQAADVKQYLLDEIDSVEDLVKQLGLSINTILTNYTKTVDLPNFGSYALKSQIPVYDFTPYALKTQLPDLSSYALKSQIVTYDLSGYRLKSDTINYNDLSNKPTIPTIPDLTPYAKKTDIPSPFSKDYNELTNKPNIPTYDLSLYRLKTDSVSYTDLANKPTMSKLLWNQTTSFILSNTVAETNSLMTSSGNGSLVIDANPTVGTTFRLTGRGIFNTQTLGPTPTLTIKLYLGNTVIATGSVASFLLGATNRPLSFYVDFMINGTNSVYAQGSMSYFATIADNLSAAPITNNGQNSTVDLSVANQLKMTLTWSVANTANQIQIKLINLEKLNN